VVVTGSEMKPPSTGSDKFAKCIPEKQVRWRLPVYNRKPLILSTDGLEKKAALAERQPAVDNMPSEEINPHPGSVESS